MIKMAEFLINNIPVEDTYCETFTAKFARILVTSVNKKWAFEAAMEVKGLGISATTPPCEASLECEVNPKDTPDGRPGYVIQVLDRKMANLEHWLKVRIRKGAVPQPKTSVFDVLPSELAEKFIKIEDSVIQIYLTTV